jgi:hypothetical protein
MDAEMIFTKNAPIYAVEMTGVLGDKWLSGTRSNDRNFMRRFANFILNKGFDTGRRAVVVAVKVVEVKEG